MIHRLRASSLPLLVVGGVLVAGCSSETEADLIARARGHLDKGDLSTASVELKSALQKNPNSPEGRFLLGKALFKSGDVSAAEVELRKAQAAGFDPALVAPQLAQVMLAAGQFKKIISEFGGTKLTNPEWAVDLATSIAAAHAYSGELDKARELVKQVLREKPKYDRAVMLDARLNATAGGVDASVAQIRALLDAEPNNVEAMMLLAGLLQQAKQDAPGAIEIYRKVLAAKPEQIEAYSALVALYLQQRDAASAAQTFEAMQKRLPNHPRTRLVAAQLAAQRGDFKLARENVQQLLRVAPENVRILQFAGAVELELGSLAQAEAFLDKAVQLAPELGTARALLGRIHLRAGQSDKALRVLRPESEATLADGTMLALVAEAYLQRGDLNTAEQYFARALKLAPQDAKVRTAVALMQIAKGRPDAAFDELQAVSASSADTTADMALLAVRMRSNDTAGALKAIEVLERKGLAAESVATLRGQAYSVSNDVANARKSFEQAVAINPRYLPAISALANIDLAERNIAAAQKRFEALLKAEPKNSQALRTIAELRIRAGAPREEVKQSIQEAIKADPNDAAARLLQIDYLMSQKESAAAESTAQEAVAALPKAAELLDALGRVQLQAGSTQQAIITFNKLVLMKPGSPQPYLRLSEAYSRSGDDAAATSSLRRALEITPNLIQAQRGLIALALKAKKPDLALSIARDVKKQRPEYAIGYMLEGDVHASTKNWDAAVAAYTAGLTKRDPAGIQVHYHAALLSAKRAQEADRFAASWLKQYPKDGEFLKYMGDAALARRDFAGAEQRFKELADLDPNNPAILNNIAWLYLQQRKPGALPLAEKATKLEPDNANLLDTLANALVAEKQYTRAIEVGKQAIKLLPDNIALRLSIAKVFFEAGDKSLALAELDNLKQTARGHQAAMAAVEELRAQVQR